MENDTYITQFKLKVYNSLMKPLVSQSYKGYGKIDQQ